MRKLLAVCAAAALLILPLSGCSGKGGVTLTDRDGKELFSFRSWEEWETRQAESEVAAYAEIAVNEALAWIAQEKSCSAEEAKDALLAAGYTLHTALDPAAQQAAAAAFEDTPEEVAYGCAVTNLSGQLLAAVSSKGANRAAQKTAPYSALKPLSVYAPAVEAGLIHWTTLYEDSPLKQIKNEQGKLTEWPQNATGTYTHRPVTVAEALKKSLNTVAVRCLQAYGVSRSLDFLTERFGIDVTAERERAALLGADEVLGNLALGYLETGVSPVDMAGYYQVFATGGKYTAPQALMRILDANGKTVYQMPAAVKQVLKPETAAVLNRMLRTVVTPSGTGTGAALERVPVGGKTGTGDQNDGNWFVGFTPQYSCSVWQGYGVPANDSPTLFARVMKGLVHSKTAAYPADTLQEQLYCCESGGLFGGLCPQVDTGYFVAGKAPSFCKRH